MSLSLLAASNFSPLDWTIVAVYLLATLAVGVLSFRYVHNMADYLVAGRSLKSSLAIATLLGSEIGLVTVMYNSQKGFTSGFAAFHIGIAAGLGCLIVGLTGFILVPLRRMQVKTIPEFYGNRFGPGVRIFGGVLMAVAGILNMGVFLKAATVFITALTGIEDENTVHFVMAALLGMVLFYTILGGMISVVITDYIQFIVLSIGLILCCVVAVRALGWETIVDNANAYHGEPGVNPVHADGFGWAYMIWMFFTFGLVSCAVWPTAVMRACSVQDERTVRRVFSWSSIGFTTRIILPQFLGICALAYFYNDISAGSEYFDRNGKIVENSDVTLAAMPTFLGEILPIGILGIIAAGMLAAFMSTNDSYLLCWSGVLVEDVIAPATGNTLTTKQRLILARVLIFAIGLFLWAWSVFYPMGQDMLDYLAVSGAIYFTGAFSLLLFGIYWKGASRVGAYLALSTGSLAILGLTPVRNALMIPESITGAHIGLGVTALTMIVMVVGSIVFPDSTKQRLQRETSDKPFDTDQLYS